MIERVIAILQEAGFKFTATELADIFWLAVHIESSQQQPHQQPVKSATSLQPSKPDFSNTPVTTSKSQATELPVTSVNEPSSSVVLPSPPTQKPSPTENSEAIPIKIPAAKALRNSLALGRALRPLMRKVPSPTEKILDEEATVQRFAEDQIGIPVLKSTPERWLELALVVEETSITEIWEQTIREFQLLLKHHGAFRDVRTWKLKNSETEIQLLSENSTGFDESTSHKPDVLIDPKGRRLILLVSDCISPIWRQQLIHPVLELWGQRALITILQLLPEKLWDRTALVDEIPVLLSTFAPGIYNSQLIAQLWDEDDIDELSSDNNKDKSKTIKSLTSIPIITLESEPLLRWSKVLAGQGNISTAGFKFYSVSHQEKTTSNESYSQATPKLEASDLVNLFRANASLQARRLAGLMATVPVSVSVVNLIRETLLPDAREIHVAEVFMSGLLKRLPVLHQDDTEYLTYEFVDGVRELLRDFVPPNKQISAIDLVITKVSEFVAKRLGISIKEFDAQLLTHNDGALASKLRPFAKLKAQVLRQLGGKYALEAEKIELNQFLQEYAGEYICAVKWGGEAGTWHEGLEHLLISSKGEVQFRSRFGLAAIQNSKFEGQTLSWSFDDNQTAASVTFKVDSENSYFWEEHQTGKLFEGWLNYPNEGRIDFRGRFEEVSVDPQFQLFSFEVAIVTLEDEPLINLLPFAFEVATIEEKKSGGFLGFGQKTELAIKRSRQQSQYFIEELGNDVQLKMVQIPGGEFMMGAPKSEKDSSDSERAQHQVIVQPFFIGKYPITQAQWKAVAEFPTVNQKLDPDPSRFKGANRPVEKVSWYDAVEFCDRLSAYTKRQYRLPSEAEWEYACRAGTTTPFHFGETITSELANYNANYTYGAGVRGTYREETTVVGSFGLANAFGLYDMHGNVWEWCLDDWHSNYKGAPTDGSAWFDDNNNLYQKQGRAVLRGGAWIYYPNYCRSAYRYNDVRDLHNGDNAFRVIYAAGRIP
ncbi:formylglycine-generating enzyme family protein [Nostoc sp. FACHB-87]|uniref:SAV_2336 N-terminal domain-related protein n=1 Tax=Nostocaceae TaxID=1162 RepID=UPI0016890882|nr:MULTISPECIES: SAV_2336 N-terminal domain-related protein [Nostocaceae]MBD2457682.1 formylglycine-generating enzyme family protein [Nostoc sp. FACHB-87]MBD2478855.1 formylglycine-generating enzyme family protein [Anabaena sp. FACHB-83]